MHYNAVFSTPLGSRLGIKYPVLQAGMGFVAHAELAAVVSNAGGLGCIGYGSMSARELKEQIRRCRDLTARPFSFDILFAGVKASTGDDAVRYSSNVQQLIDVTFEEGIGGVSPALARRLAATVGDRVGL